MRNILLSAAAITLFAAAPALAQSGPTWYGSAGYSNLSADGTDVDLGAVTGRLGAKLHPNFGVEGEGSVGVNDDQIGAVDVELEHDLAAYAVGYLPLNPNLELFARVGYGTTSIEASSGALAVTVNQVVKTGFHDHVGRAVRLHLGCHRVPDGEGVGANYFFDGVNGVRADWTRRDFRDDGGEADVWTLGYVRRF